MSIKRKIPIKYGGSEPTPKVLREAKKDLRELRNFSSLNKAKKDPYIFPLDLGVCWMCWIDLTNKYLTEWRVEPYSSTKEHDLICPLCGYSRWKGRIWYPFRLLRGYIGNPSSRFGISGKNDSKMSEM